MASRLVKEPWTIQVGSSAGTTYGLTEHYIIETDPIGLTVTFLWPPSTPTLTDRSGPQPILPQTTVVATYDTQSNAAITLAQLAYYTGARS